MNKLNSTCLFQGITTLMKVKKPKHRLKLCICYIFKNSKFLPQSVKYLSSPLQFVGTYNKKKFRHLHIQGVPGGMCQTSGGCSFMLKYTDITQNTYVQSGTVTEIMAREMCGLLVGPRTVPVGLQNYPCRP